MEWTAADGGIWTRERNDLAASLAAVAAVIMQEICVRLETKGSCNELLEEISGPGSRSPDLGDGRGMQSRSDRSAMCWAT
jgi:hypothetical protein